MGRVKKRCRVPSAVVGYEACGPASSKGPEVGRSRVWLRDCRVFRDLDRRSSGWAAPVSVENAAGLVVAILLTVFLLAAILFPERF